MGLPSMNEEGYRNGSPVWFAANMKDTQRLMIIHGTGNISLYEYSIVYIYTLHRDVSIDVVMRRR